MPVPTGPSAGCTRTASTSIGPSPHGSGPVTWNCTVVAVVLTTDTLALLPWHCVVDGGFEGEPLQAAAARMAAPKRRARTVRRGIGWGIFGSSPAGTILGSVRHH